MTSRFPTLPTRSRSSSRPNRGRLLPLALAVAIAVSGAAGNLRAQEPRPDALRSWTIDHDRSTLWVETGRAGLLSFLGDEHAILPRDWSAEICMARPVERGAHGSITIRTDSLVIDTDSARALADLGEGPDEGDREDIQRKMLGSENLAADRHPEIRLELWADGPEEDGSVPVEGTLTVRGVRVDVSFPLEIRAEADHVSLSGSTIARQTEFGIEPESVAGVVNVEDEVELHVDLVAAPTEEGCEPASATRGPRPEG